MALNRTSSMVGTSSARPNWTFGAISTAIHSHADAGHTNCPLISCVMLKKFGDIFDGNSMPYNRHIQYM